MSDQNTKRKAFDPANESIMEYLLRRCDDYPNKSDLVRATGISHGNLSKFLNSKHNPRVGTIQPLFSFFIREDRKTSRRPALEKRDTKSVH